METILGRIRSTRYRAETRGPLVKIEGQAPMSVGDAEAFAAETSRNAYAKRAPRDPVMWVEQHGSGYVVFWNDCTPEQIKRLLPIIEDDGRFNAGEIE